MAPAPLDLYRGRIASGMLVPDGHQAWAVGILQRLHAELTKSKKNRVPGIFFSKNEASKGVYLHGPVGRGKTMLMDMFYEALPQDVPKRRVHFHEFMITVHDFMHRARLESRTDRERESALLAYARDVAKAARVLCFDEFHVTDVADAMILGRLFKAMVGRGVVIVATSNWPPEKLYEDGLQRDRFIPFIGLLKEKLEIIEVNGAVDYRLKFLSETGVYFWPLDEHARRKADEIFARLTENAVPQAQTLTVKGRVLEIPAAARGVARLNFAELCERPLGAEDYLAIADAYHTVFLEDMPWMGGERRNEARRLTTLVDTLYDRGTRLVVTAEAAPQGLYRGDDHAFEFQRTASRLIEMQSPQYLAAGRGS